MPKPLVPEFEPEIVRHAANRNWRGCPDKVATTSLKRLFHRGVDIQSRYDKAEEYRAMLEIVEALPEAMARDVASLFCDSKATATYSVRADVPDKQLAHIAAAISAICRGLFEGHNGVSVHGREPDGTFRAGHHGYSIHAAYAYEDPEWDFDCV